MFEWVAATQQKKMCLCAPLLLVLKSLRCIFGLGVPVFSKSDITQKRRADWIDVPGVALQVDKQAQHRHIQCQILYTKYT